ncbi:ATP-binding protein [Paraburkholderia sp. BL6669N2]|uniref:ATP-binding protein n=1 Tax=Paraburkholderia sp. BL6669N2 TaxID=1938807 RepID=UPI0015F267A9|nr:ATP-binding protein [Paraburkholderia sp. BL6669N2]
MLFVTQTDVIKRLHGARATGLCERKFLQFVRLPLPLQIIDDFALNPAHAARRRLPRPGAARYERGATILTSNLDVSGCSDSFHKMGYRRRDTRPATPRSLPHRDQG